MKLHIAGPSALRVLRLAAVLGASAGAYVACCSLLLWGLQSSWSEARTGVASLDGLATLSAAGLAWLCLTWITLGVVLSSAAALTGRASTLLTTAADTIAPATVRRMTSALLGAAVVMPVSAGAASATAHESPSTSGVAAHAVSLPVLDRPAVPMEPSPSHVLSARVRPGDTLWQIAAEALPDNASAHDIARAWPRWYEANRAVIGGDPDLLKPGQNLAPPKSTPTPTPTPPPTQSKELR